MTVPAEAFGIIAVVIGAISTAFGFLIKALWRKFNEWLKGYELKIDGLITTVDNIKESIHEAKLEQVTTKGKVEAVLSDVNELRQEVTGINKRVVDLEKWSRKVTEIHNKNHPEQMAKLEML